MYNMDIDTKKWRNNMDFMPDYKNIVDAAWNIEAKRLPLYEHIISEKKMEKILNRQFADLISGDHEEKKEFFRNYCGFFKDMGYDTVSYEVGIRGVFIGGGALDQHIKGVIQTREDFKNYPWDEIPVIYFKKATGRYNALREMMPAGMKAIGGPGNGVFECVQDLVGYMDLCIMAADDHELYEDVFKKVSETILIIWKKFLAEFKDIYCVTRMGDDLGYKSNTLISKKDIVSLVIPGYEKVVSEAHRYNKPFLLHSCGNIFNIMDEIITTAQINAKHSNEDQIAPFPEWVDRYGDRIGNFGGVDADVLCRYDKPQLKEYILDVIRKTKGKGGIAFGTGNSIPEYIPTDNYLYMLEVVRENRGDYKK